MPDSKSRKFPEGNLTIEPQELHDALKDAGLDVFIDNHGNIKLRFENLILAFPDSLLAEAHHKVRGAREKEYGNKLKNFTDIAAIQSIVSGMKRTAESVALDMICVKLARLLKSPDHYDTLVDLIGYVLCYRDIRRERNPDQYTMEEERFRHELKTDKPPQSGI